MGAFLTAVVWLEKYGVPGLEVIGGVRGELDAHFEQALAVWLGELANIEREAQERAWEKTR